MKATLAALRTTAEGKGQELLLLTAEFSQEGDRWVAVCQELGTSSYGKDFEDAKQQLERSGAPAAQRGQAAGFQQCIPRGARPKADSDPEPKGQKAQRPMGSDAPGRLAVNISGRQIMARLRKDGWQEGGRWTHGVFLHKQFPGERIPRSTLVPDKSDPLPDGTLGAILGVRQTGLSKKGLSDLVKKYGLP